MSDISLSCDLCHTTLLSNAFMSLLLALIIPSSADMKSVMKCNWLSTWSSVICNPDVDADVVLHVESILFSILSLLLSVLTLSFSDCLEECCVALSIRSYTAVTCDSARRLAMSQSLVSLILGRPAKSDPLDDIRDLLVSRTVDDTSLADDSMNDHSTSSSYGVSRGRFGNFVDESGGSDAGVDGSPGMTVVCDVDRSRGREWVGEFHWQQR